MATIRADPAGILGKKEKLRVKADDGVCTLFRSGGYMAEDCFWVPGPDSQSVFRLEFPTYSTDATIST